MGLRSIGRSEPERIHSRVGDGNLSLPLFVAVYLCNNINGIGNETKVVTTLPSFLRCCCSKIHPPTTCKTQRKLRTRPQSIRKPLNSNPCYCEHVKQCHPFCGHVIPSALPRAAASSLVVSSSGQATAAAARKAGRHH